MTISPGDANRVTQTVLPGGAVLATLDGTQPGPTLAVLGGVHGDEDEGVLALGRILCRLGDVPLAGMVRAVAPANPAAWAAHRRTSPLDGGDLARSFPGDPQGGPTSQLAAGITEQVIEGADLLVDLHSAGVRYAMPLMCGFMRGAADVDVSRSAAIAFGAPVIWEHPGFVPGRSLSAADDRKVPAIYVECSGGGGIREADLDAYVEGVLSVMAHLEMVPESSRVGPVTRTRFVYGDGDLDAGVQAPHAGLFVAASDPGDVVTAGTAIGAIYDLGGRDRRDITAPADGMVMFLRRQARVQAGDVLVVLARLDDEAHR